MADEKEGTQDAAERIVFVLLKVFERLGIGFDKVKDPDELISDTVDRRLNEIRAEAIAGIRFPVELRKMWSGTDVQEWLNGSLPSERPDGLLPLGHGPTPVEESRQRKGALLTHEHLEYLEAAGLGLSGQGHYTHAGWYEPEQVEGCHRALAKWPAWASQVLWVF